VRIDRAAVVLRTRTIPEVLDLACRVMASKALGLYLRLSALCLLPLLVVCVGLRYLLDVGWWFPWLTAVTLASVLQGVFTVAAGRLLFAERVGLREVMGAYGSRFGAYLGALFLSRMLLVVSLFLLATRCIFVHEAALLEMASPSAALRRSSRFVLGEGANAFPILVLLFLSQLAIVLTAELMGQALVEDVLQLGRPLGHLFTQGGSAYALAGYLVSLPYVATARFLLYIDRRTRSDGWDIQVRFMAIAARQREARRVAA
jgi:hypothetical protein